MPHEPDWDSDDLMMRTERTETIPCPDPHCESGSVPVTFMGPTHSHAMEPNWQDGWEDCPTCKGREELVTITCLVCGGDRSDGATGDSECRCDEDAMAEWLERRLEVA